MKRLSLRSIGHLVAPFILSLSLPVSSQDNNLLDPSNFSSSIAKKLAVQVSQPDELKRTMVNFVNNSQSPLMCKLQVSRIWEQVMRSRAGLEANKQSMATSNSPDADILVQSSLLSVFSRELATTLNQIDSYCGSSPVKKN